MSLRQPFRRLARISLTELAGLVIINREPTGLDDLADLVIHAEIGPTLDAAVNP